MRKKKLRLAPRPELMDGADPRSRALRQQREHDDAFRTLAETALSKRDEVFVDVPAGELDRRLIETFRAARSALQEGGANTLFLAVGFLRWKERGDAKTVYRAPLVLYPAVLGRPNTGGAFTLARDDDVEIAVERRYTPLEPIRISIFQRR